MDLTSQNTKKNIYYKREKNGIVAYDMYTGKIVGKSDSLAELVGDSATMCTYHPVLVDQICDRMVENGLSLRKVCSEPGYPTLSTVMRWMRVHSEVRDKLDLAREMLAEQFHDEIMALEMEGGRDDVASDKAKFEKLKYLAGVNAPERYGNRTTVVGDEKMPVQFVISTGIDRGGQGGEKDTGRVQQLCDPDIIEVSKSCPGSTKVEDPLRKPDEGFQGGFQQERAAD